MQSQFDRRSPIAPDVLAAVFDAAPVACAVVGPDHTIRAWNGAAERLTGWSAEDVIGGEDPLVPDDERAMTAMHLTEWIEDPDLRTRTVLRRERADGSTLHLTLEASAPVELPDGSGLAVWFHETTDVDALLVQRHGLARSLVGATRIEQVLPVLSDAVRDLLGASAAVVLRQCPPADHLHGTRGVGIATEVAEQIQLDLGAGHPWDGAVREAITDGRMVVDGVEHDASFVPMGPDGDGWVLATLDTRAAGETAYVQDLFRAVADEAWAALQRVALVGELDGKIEILEATNRLAGSVGLDLDHALAAVSRQAAEALSCERAAVYLVDPVDGSLALAHVHASDASPAELLAEADGLALASEVIEARAEVLYQDVTSCEAADGPWHADAGSVAVMGLPLQVAQRTVGALVVAHTIAHPRGFTSLCQQVGAAVAQQAALAVEHARLFATERDTVQRLEELDQLKADWMAGVTHDLRAPLTSLFGFVELLQEAGDRISEAEQQEYLAVISRRADELVDLVEDLVLSARVDAADVGRRRALVSMRELVDDAVDALPVEQRRAVAVTDDGVPTPVVVDRAHMHRVLSNLLSNALRHGGSATTVTLGHDTGRVLVAIEDDGPGVPPEERDRIFDRYVHGEHEASSGLGLFVARGIVLAHDGSLRVTDRLDGTTGARFELRIPRAHAQRADDVPDPAPAEGGERRR